MRRTDPPLESTDPPYLDLIDVSKKPSLKPSLKSGMLENMLGTDEWIKDSGCSKHMTGNKSLFSTYKAYDGGNVVFGSNLKGKIIGKVEESLNMTFYESLPPTKVSPLVDDDVGEEEAIKRNTKVSAAATVAAACASVRQWLAASVAAAWWRVARRSIGIDVPVRLGLTFQANTVSLRQINGVPGYTPARAFIIVFKNEDAILKSQALHDMSNSDELRHTGNTTLVPPRLPDTLPQVYHRRRPTLGLLILPSVSPFPPTIRRTARISVLPIEPNLVERARISAINLDDYQLDPVTPPPSPSSPFPMAAYQRMIAETDPTQREEALTAYGTETGQGSVPVP
ncbi:hypothetical protein Tco_0749147 [Tanacetum coccineum]|uniref:Retrovirus-related Pol polyprotein from transposon TNT 1-94-like beta-barrel domain-containing protein n=1 Tax=Tanacetum coccineum TaxID=301880 RepID=A0ABQ4Z050_9ASTR